MAKTTAPIKCERATCKFHDGAGLCILEKPLLSKKEAYVNCLSHQNKTE